MDIETERAVTNHTFNTVRLAELEFNSQLKTRTLKRYCFWGKRKNFILIFFVFGLAELKNIFTHTI